MTKNFLTSDTFITANPDSLSTPEQDCESLRILVMGSHRGVTSTIQTLHVLGFADISHWSTLLPVPKSSDVMSILTRRIARERST